MSIPNIKSITIVPNPVDVGASYHVTVEFYADDFHGTTAYAYANNQAEPEIYSGEGAGLL